MSFVFDEFVNVLKLVYMKEESFKIEDVYFILNLEKNNGEVLKEKCFRKYKYKKYLFKLKFCDKKKYK